jgi:hypothetical protein
MQTSRAVMNQAARPMEQYEVEESPTGPHIVHLRSVDWERLESEDRLGCARGVVWALVFEVVLAIAAVVYWKLRFFPH